MKYYFPVVLLLLLVSPACAQQENREQPQDALKSIESTRGGRHWVDEKTAPPRSPEESLKAFQIEPGAKIELFAAEPLVMDPVAIAFDEQGRMFVVEYGDYPVGPQEGEKPLSKIVFLEDTDGDFRADKRHLFADGLNFAHSLMAWKGGLLVGAQTQLIYLKDTDGDHQADVKEVLFEGFVPAHPQMQIGNPRWGLDNWIYCNYGPGEITSPAQKDFKLTMSRNEFRFNPLTLQAEPTTGLGQYGNTIDNQGRRFFATNRNPIITVTLSWHEWRRNPFAVIPDAQYDVGPSGGDTKVYPLVAMKSNYLSHAGTHTAACGVTAYRGDLLGEKFRDSVFVCEPIGHLVTRNIIVPDGAGYTSKRAREKADFLASTDTWFRPSSLETGPDGALYLADMYRLWVEHPKFLPPEIAEKLDWRAGEDRGRIWRIIPAEAKTPSKFTAPETTADLVQLLESPNGWRRSLGQRLLVERQDQQAAPLLRGLLTKSGPAYARMHALHTLDGLGTLTPADVRTGLKDADPLVRTKAIQLAAKFLESDASLLADLEPLASARTIQERNQLVLTLGETEAPEATAMLIQLARRDGADRFFQQGLLSAVKQRSGAVLAGLLADAEFVAKPNAGKSRLIRELAAVTGARGDAGELAGVLGQIARADKSGAWWQTVILSGLATGLPRHSGPLGRISLAKLLAEPPAPFAESVQSIRGLMSHTQAIALDTKQSLSDRVAAIELLGYQPLTDTEKAYRQLLTPHQPAEVQLACLEALRKSGSPVVGEILLDNWDGLGASSREPALEMLLARTETIKQTLQAMADGKISPALISIDGRVRLLRHGDESIRKLATELLGGAVSANRRQVVEDYRSSLTLKPDLSAGEKVFKRICIKCHRHHNEGHEVGPDISDVRNRSREALLYDILDPNRKLEPKFTDYTVVTGEGLIYNGLMVSETADAVILRQAEGKQQVIPRNDIEILKASGKSLMPEGVEKDITVQEMADLLEFLQAGQKQVSAGE